MRRIHKFQMLAIAAFTIVIFSSSDVALAGPLVDPGTTVEFDEGEFAEKNVDSCSGLNSCVGNVLLFDRRVEAGTVLAAGIAQSKQATVTMVNTFTVSEGDERIVDATLSGTVNWKGELTAFGVLTNANVKIKVNLVDTTTGVLAAGTTLLDAECEDLVGLNACIKPVSGSRAVNLTTKLIRGHDYEIRFELQCKSSSGALGVDIFCVFAPTDGIIPDGFAKRSVFSLSVQDDIVGLIKDLQASVDLLDSNLMAHDMAVQAKLMALQDSVDDNNKAILETIRLLHTPKGRRSSDFLACGGAPCDFPNKR